MAAHPHEQAGQAMSPPIQENPSTPSARYDFPSDYSQDGPEPGELSVVLAAHNEAATIERVLFAFHRDIVLPTGAELIVCEDGSTDGTDRILKSMAATKPFRLIADRRRKGYAEAVRDGLKEVKTPFVFFSDSDGQYEPRDFWRLWSHARNYDMIIGRKVSRDEPLHRIVLSRGFHVLSKALFNVPLQDIDCGFRLIRRELVSKILPDVRFLPYSFWAEFTILAHLRGFRILEVPISHRRRLNGITSIYRVERLPSIVMKQLRGVVQLDRACKGSRLKA